MLFLHCVISSAQSDSAPRVSSITFTEKGVMKYRVLRTKTQPHGKTVMLGCSQVDICAPCTMTRYLKARQEVSHVKADSYLFSLQSMPLTAYSVNAFIQELVQSVGWDPARYPAHSLRAGAASSAALAGFQEWELKKMGGWESKAYMSYIREQDDTVAGFAKRLVNV